MCARLYTWVHMCVIICPFVHVCARKLAYVTRLRTVFNSMLGLLRRLPEPNMGADCFPSPYFLQRHFFCQLFRLHFTGSLIWISLRTWSAMHDFMVSLQTSTFRFSPSLSFISLLACQNYKKYYSHHVIIWKFGFGWLFWLVGCFVLFLWHINLCRLFSAKSMYIQITSSIFKIWFSIRT